MGNQNLKKLISSIIVLSFLIWGKLGISLLYAQNKTTQNEIAKRSRAILKFVCKNDESWSIQGIVMSTSTADTTGESVGDPSVPDSVGKQMHFIANSDKNWVQKLTEMAAMTPMWIEVGCIYSEQIQIRDVIAKFGKPDRIGKPDRKGKGTISSSPSNIMGELYYYGSVRLGVCRDDRREGEYILYLRIDGPEWQKEMEFLKLK
jgi:hypothetical protein